MVALRRIPAGDEAAQVRPAEPDRQHGAQDAAFHQGRGVVVELPDALAGDHQQSAVAAGGAAFEEVAEGIREEVERSRRLQVLKDLAIELRAKAVIERD